ncbi:MAG: hypothetical protein LBI92_07205 [Azoarcus sp.]|nr:hypothetical protein [Azoarcus sp.]
MRFLNRCLGDANPGDANPGNTNLGGANLGDADPGDANEAHTGQGPGILAVFGPFCTHSLGRVAAQFPCSYPVRAAPGTPGENTSIERHAPC